jgi:hypothetical protein
MDMVNKEKDACTSNKIKKNRDSITFIIFWDHEFLVWLVRHPKSDQRVHLDLQLVASVDVVPSPVHSPCLAPPRMIN